MTLEDIIEIFGTLDGLSNMRDAKAAEYGLICQEYLTHLKVCFTDVSDSQKQTWLTSTKPRLLGELQQLKTDNAFNRYTAIINSMHDDVLQNGAVLQSLVTTDEVYQLITQLNATINISTDILYEEENPDNLTDIFIELEQVEENFEKQAWDNVTNIFRRFYPRLQACGIDNLSELQYQKLTQYQKLYILAMSGKASTWTTFEKTVTEFHEVLCEIHNLSTSDNLLITACLIDAFKKITAFEDHISNINSGMGNPLLTDLIVLAIDQQKLLRSSELANLISIFQLNLIYTLMIMPSNSQESIINNLLLAHRLLLDYIYTTNDKLKFTTLYTIQTNLYQHIKVFALAAHPPETILAYLRKIIRRNNLISPNDPQWVDHQIWVAHQRQYLIELGSCVKILGVKLGYQQNIQLLETLLEQHNTIPPALAISLDVHRMIVCQEELAIAYYFLGVEFDNTKQFNQSIKQYERALSIFNIIIPSSNTTKAYQKNVTYKWIIALANSGLQQAVSNGNINVVAQQRIDRAVVENNSVNGFTFLDAAHQSQFAKLLYDYACNIYNGTPDKTPALPYFQLAAAEINKLNFNSCTPTIQGQIKTYNECVNTMAYIMCEKFTDLELCDYNKVTLLTTIFAKYPQNLAAKLSKAMQINSGAFSVFAKEFKIIVSSNTFIGFIRSNSLQSQEIAAHFNHVTTNPTLESYQSFRIYINALEQVNPKSDFMPLLNKVSASLANLIMLTACAFQQTHQLRITA
jgi:hypothetical protein